MPINLSVDEIPAIAEKSEGDEMTLKLTVRQSSATKDGEAEFEVIKSSSRPATEDETRDKLSFEEASKEAAAETLQPSSTGLEDNNTGV